MKSAYVDSFFENIGYKEHYRKRGELKEKCDTLLFFCLKE